MAQPDFESTIPDAWHSVAMEQRTGGHRIGEDGPTRIEPRERASRFQRLLARVFTGWALPS